MGAKNTHIVRDSEAAAYWNEGKLEIIEGPAVIYPAKDSVVEPIQFFSANERQYLKVEFSDGHTEHIPGPVRMMQHPTEHRSIDVCRANEVSADEVIVVMTKAHKKAGDGRMERQVIRGPCMHIPAVGEVQQEFSWHGSDPNNPGRKCPNALRFTKLRVIPDQMYLSVPEVRTSDDALVVINLMIFYELRDVETMLNRTHDPIADFMNAATADVILFAATLSYELFLEKTDLLNKLESYPQLVTRAKSIGFDVTKVVYRGYTAPPRLQSMHDDAIQARTQLRLEAETEEQAQRLADMKLTKEFQRQKQKQEMQKQEVEHTNQLSRMQHEEKLGQNTKDVEVDIESERKKNGEKLNYLRSLKDLGVDLNGYLSSLNPRPDQLIQINGADANPTNMHIHSEAKPKK